MASGTGPQHVIAALARQLELSEVVARLEARLALT
jgi:hypothetical protein